MARQLLNAGYDLQVHNRTKEKALGLMQSGAVWKDSPAEAAEGADTETQGLENLELGPGNGGTEDMDEDEPETIV